MWTESKAGGEWVGGYCFGSRVRFGDCVDGSLRMMGEWEQALCVNVAGVVSRGEQ